MGLHVLKVIYGLPAKTRMISGAPTAMNFNEELPQKRLVDINLHLNDVHERVPP